MGLDLKNLQGKTLPFPLVQRSDNVHPPQPKPKKVAVCVPHLEMMAAPFVMSVVDLFIKGKHKYVPVWAGGSDSAMARNHAIRTAPSDVDYYLFIDSDMGFFVSDADKLVDLSLDVVSAVCFQKHHPYMPCVFYKNDQGTHAHMESWKHGEVIEVAACGGAFMCVAAPVINAMKDKYQSTTGSPWFEWGKAYSEDLMFCERVKECGFKVNVDTGILVDHFTMAPRGKENFIEANQIQDNKTTHHVELRV